MAGRHSVFIIIFAIITGKLIYLFLSAWGNFNTHFLCYFGVPRSAGRHAPGRRERGFGAKNALNFYTHLSSDCSWFRSSIGLRNSSLFCIFCFYWSCSCSIIVAKEKLFPVLDCWLIYPKYRPLTATFTKVNIRGVWNLSCNWSKAPTESLPLPSHCRRYLQDTREPTDHGKDRPNTSRCKGVYPYDGVHLDNDFGIVRFQEQRSSHSEVSS